MHYKSHSPILIIFFSFLLFPREVNESSAPHRSGGNDSLEKKFQELRIDHQKAINESFEKLNQDVPRNLASLLKPATISDDQVPLSYLLKISLLSSALLLMLQTASFIAIAYLYFVP